MGKYGVVGLGMLGMLWGSFDFIAQDSCDASALVETSLDRRKGYGHGLVGTPSLGPCLSFGHVIVCRVPQGTCKVRKAWSLRPASLLLIFVDHHCCRIVQRTAS
jgi:hypothetical protein